MFSAGIELACPYSVVSYIEKDSSVTCRHGHTLSFDFSANPRSV